jgi:hypothetical protein
LGGTWLGKGGVCADVPPIDTRTLQIRTDLKNMHASRDDLSVVGYTIHAKTQRNAKNKPEDFLRLGVVARVS